jgi:hypothetical protein
MREALGIAGKRLSVGMGGELEWRSVLKRRSWSGQLWKEPGVPFVPS